MTTKIVKSHLEKMIEGLQYIKFLESVIEKEIRIMSDDDRIYCRIIPSKDEIRILDKIGWKYNNGELYFSTIPF